MSEQPLLSQAELTIAQLLAPIIEKLIEVAPAITEVLKQNAKKMN